MNEFNEHLKRISSIHDLIKGMSGIDLVDFDNVDLSSISQNLWLALKTTTAIHTGVLDYLDTVGSKSPSDEICEMVSLIINNNSHMEARADMFEEKLSTLLQIEPVPESIIKRAMTKCIVHKVLLCYDEVLNAALRTTSKLLTIMHKNKDSICSTNKEYHMYA
jgi:hypothetical protein